MRFGDVTGGKASATSEGDGARSDGGTIFSVGDDTCFDLGKTNSDGTDSDVGKISSSEGDGTCSDEGMISWDGETVFALI